MRYCSYKGPMCPHSVWETRECKATIPPHNRYHQEQNHQHHQHQSASTWHSYKSLQVILTSPVTTQHGLWAPLLSLQWAVRPQNQTFQHPGDMLLVHLQKLASDKDPIHLHCLSTTCFIHHTGEALVRWDANMNTSRWPKSFVVCRILKEDPWDFPWHRVSDILT